jgi:hypothetical protein
MVATLLLLYCLRVGSGRSSTETAEDIATFMLQLVYLYLHMQVQCLQYANLCDWSLCEALKDFGLVHLS